MCPYNALINADLSARHPTFTIVTTASAADTRIPLPRRFHLWVGGALASQLGDAAFYFALGWAATAHGGAAAGLVLSTIGLTRTLLLLLGGTVADRIGAHRVMIAGDGIMLLVSVVVAAAAWQWGTPLSMLALTALLIGTVDAFYLPAAGSMPRRLVEPAQLPRALALRQGGHQLVSIVGGPLGGVVVAAAGFAAAAGMDAATFAIVLVALIVIRPRRASPDTQRRHLAREALEGVRVALTTKGLGPTLLLLAGAAGFIMPVSSILIPLLARAHSWPAVAAGFIVGAQGAGAVLVMLVVARRGIGKRPGTAALAGLLITALGQTTLAVAPTIPSAGIGAIAMGVGTGLFISHLSPVMLGAAPRSHLARVQALLSLVQSVALAVTNNILGDIAHGLNARDAVFVCAAVLVLCATGGYASRTVRQLTTVPSQ